VAAILIEVELCAACRKLSREMLKSHLRPVPGDWQAPFCGHGSLDGEYFSSLGAN
jgi:hypothetical protein